MKPSTLLQSLKKCSKAEFVELLLEIALFHPTVENLLRAKFDSTTPVPDFESYKGAVSEEFFPDWGCGNGSPSIAYRMLQRVESEATNIQQVLDFLFFCVETGVQYTNDYGDIHEEFYMAFEDLFERAAKLALANGLSKVYSQQAENIVTSTAGIGWGFHDELNRIFIEYFAGGEAA